MPCAASLVVVQFVFWPGVALTAYLVAKHNQFGITDALLAAIGLKKYRRTFLINAAIAGTILGPLCIILWMMQSCQS